MRQLSFTVDPIPPFRLELAAWAIRRRPSNIVDRWDGRAYRRAIVVDEHPVEVEVEQPGGADSPTLRVTASGPRLPPATRRESTAVLERVLGLAIDLRPFYRLADREPHLRDLAERFRGLKPPRFPSVFEALVNGIACQQLSLSVGIILLNRLTAQCGSSVGVGADAPRAFPCAEDVARLHPGRLRALGYSYHKATALLSLARAVDHGLDLEALHSLDDADAVEQLEALPGAPRPRSGIAGTGGRVRRNPRSDRPGTSGRVRSERPGGHLLVRCSHVFPRWRAPRCPGDRAARSAPARGPTGARWRRADVSRRRRRGRPASSFAPPHGSRSRRHRASANRAQPAGACQLAASKRGRRTWFSM
jgi:DNA-3-methyladenine glycosylase II